MTGDDPDLPPDLPYQILEKTTRYKGRFEIIRYSFRHRRYDGRWSRAIQREVFERGHAAAVLPYDPGRDRVVLIEQFRPGALAAELDPWLVEVVAGIIDPGETAEDVARREAVEEAGCQIGALERIGSFLMTPGACSETVTMFCGEVDSDGVGGIHGLDEEDEDIRVTTAPTAEALERLAAGEIVNCTTVLCLQWLALHRDRLREQWT